MNLLAITNNLNRASFRQRIGVYLETMRSNGINYEVAKLPSGCLARIKLFKRAADFDAVLLHKKGLNFFDAGILGRYSRKIIYNFDDAVMYDPDRPGRTSGPHMKRFIRSVRLADMVITGSSYLAEHARAFNSNVRILPLGLKVDDYRSDCSREKDAKSRLVWIGSKSTLKYLAEIKEALEEIALRYNNVVLRIICDEFFDLENMPVEKRLWSKETRGIDLATSDIGLAPLPNNRFTKGKCSFKVLEYASAGLPVVASPIGTNSDHIHDNVTGFLVTNTQEWVDRIAQLIENERLRKKMGQKGRAYAEKFDVSVIGKSFVNLIRKTIR